jgi:16S rRNA (uracil1498-N3)-methyltransferase
MAHRYFLTDINENTATVTDSEAVHLCRVMRIKSGDEVILCDNNGYDYRAVAKEISEKIITFDVLEKTKNQAEPTKDLVVYMALPKSDKLEFIVQKACELGARKLVPFVSEFCVAQKSKKEDNKKARLEKISAEAAKQCGRSCPMAIGDTLTFKQLLQDMQKNDVNLFFYEHADMPLNRVDFADKNNISVIIGSEGGFSEKECAQLAENGAVTISLGKRILRCETAAVSAVTLTMYTLGEME